MPQSFIDKMRRLLGDEFDAFIASYQRPRKYGFRVNGLKLSTDDYLKLSPWGEWLVPIPWAADGYYYEEGDRPGKHPHYHAGFYYIQEPSAMVPAELLDVQPGDRVLDLCAAPGGKSTQLAAKLQGSGILVTNDNARERTKALAKNIELAGIRNAVVLNEEPAALANVFEGWFDRILVDAPCSGEGMFRKDESMIGEWERHSVARCSVMQRDILRHAERMLAPGGTLVYSTCTFSPEENEAQIAELLAACPELDVVPVQLAHGWAPGRPEWTNAEVIGRTSSEPEQEDDRINSISGTVRLWPHLTEGEGHYAAVLRKRPQMGRDGRQEKAQDEDGLLFTDTQLSGGKSREYVEHDGERHDPRESGRSTSDGEQREARESGRRGTSDVEQREMRESGRRGTSDVEQREARESGRRGTSDREQREARESGRRGTSDREQREMRASGRGRAAGRAERGGMIRAEAGNRGRKGARGEGLKRADGSGVAGGVDAAEAWRRFAAEQLVGAEYWAGEPIAYGSRVYLQPPGLPRLDGLRVVRAGWFVGEAGPHRFQPSQALAMGLRCGEAALTLRLRADEEVTLRYLKGETLHIDASRLVGPANGDNGPASHDQSRREAARNGTKGNAAKGYVLVCADDCPIGWGKYSGDGLLKNELPAGWRWM
nr:RsmF rRNA methyltransferase first C-terminal domain-containing protein [Paenibacillus oenotherae]